MANGAAKNLANLFKETRSRTIILVTVFLIILGIVIGILRLRSVETGPEASAQLPGIPTKIESVPGSINPTKQYAQLVEKQNVQKAKEALKTGGSSVPTIVRLQRLQPGQEVVQPEGGLGFNALAREQEGLGGQKSLWQSELKKTNCDVATIKKVIAEGAKLSDLKQIGCSACNLKEAGFTAKQLKDAGYSDDELRGAGFSPEDIRNATGLPPGVTAADVRAAGCDVEALKKLRQAGVTAAAIRSISGCTAAQLKAAGYSAKDLKDAGFSALDLKNAGFSAKDLKDAGFSAGDLAKAGFSSNELAGAGFSPEEISAAEKSAQFIPGGYTADQLRKNGCDPVALKKAREAGVSAATLHNVVGCSAAALKQAGYSAADLKAAGFTAKELKDAGFSAKELKDAGFSPEDLKAAGFSAKELKDAGFSARQLKNAGFTAKELKDAGFSPASLKAAGFSAKELKGAGFTAKDLSNAGFSAQDLKDAGYSAADLKNAGFTQEQLQAAGFSPEQLKNLFVPGELNVQLPGVPSVSTGKVAPGGNPQLQAVLARQVQQESLQKRQQDLNRFQSAISSEATTMLASWSTPNQVYVQGPEPKDKTTGKAIGLGSVAAEGAAAGAVTGENAIKAGDIMFAVLDTSVNSDEPGPVLATIVQGKLKGARLIGSLSRPQNAERVILNFQTLSIPAASKTIPINAVAVDPTTARTALSSKTDNHYLLRYGSLFAASFINGLGNAYQATGTTISINGSSATVAQEVSRSVKDNVIIGLGQVGKNWSTVAKQNFNTPPTVYVYSGTGMGILFLKDVQVNEQQQ
ncbi:MAG: type IVB secretion system protein DotG/IcmE [Proteobacteria bacterium]|nr:type IVB secretion system protein DotG/IcmE [Pseudomonadota bacterium]